MREGSAYEPAVERILKYIFFIASSKVRVSRTKMEETGFSLEDLHGYTSSSYKKLGYLLNILYREGLIRRKDGEAGVFKRNDTFILAEKGRALGRWFARRHRLIEVMLFRWCAVDINALYDSAEMLEGGFDKRMTMELAKILGNPLSCPHNEVIPEA